LSQITYTSGIRFRLVMPGLVPRLSGTVCA
jgi:hypothetical protein